MTLGLSIDLAALNWLAIPVAAIASFVVGGVWYAALFGKAWVRLHGYAEADLQAMARTQGVVFALFFLSDLITATVLAIILANVDSAGALEGLGVAALLWLGFTATNLLMHNAAHRKPVAAYCIDASHSLVSLCVMGLILGAWR